MALILSIELSNATFEDLATLVSTAGAAGADDSTVIEIDDNEQVLRVIIEDPIAPDVDTSDPSGFTLIDDGYDPSFDDDSDDFVDDFIDDSADPTEFYGPDPRGFGGLGGYGEHREPRGPWGPQGPWGPHGPQGPQSFGRHFGRGFSGNKPFDISGAINDFIENIASEFSFGGRRNRGGRHGGFRGRGNNGFPPADYLYGLAEDYFRDYGYRGHNNRSDDRQDDRRDGYRDHSGDNRHWGERYRDDHRRDEPLQDDFYSDESSFEKPDFDKPRSEEPRSEKPRDEQPRSEHPREERRRDENPFGSAFGSANPFGPGTGNDFGELRDAGGSFLKGLSDFINDRVDRRTDGSGKRPGGRANGYGSFGNPDVGDEHPEGTSRQDKDTEDKLGEFTDFSGYDNVGDIEDLENLGKDVDDSADSGADHDGEYSPSDDSRGDSRDDSEGDSNEDRDENRDDK
ncbi:hypothetical protein [Corynebacterium casei]|uniref:hypothetical protein n=1 Tax=Corynebacterium casei TaxID=160386 RepID=UPI003F8DF3A6